MKENLRKLTTLAGLVTVGHVVGCSSAVSPDLSDDPTPVFMPSADAIAFGQLEVQWAPSGSGQALRQIREQKTLPDDYRGELYPSPSPIRFYPTALQINH